MKPANDNLPASGLEEKIVSDPRDYFGRRPEFWEYLVACGILTKTGDGFKLVDIHDALVKFRTSKDYSRPLWDLWTDIDSRDSEWKSAVCRDMHESSLHQIYFVSCDVALKIGTSKMPEIRLRELQCCNPSVLTIIGTMPGGPRTEAWLHSHFYKHHIRGEWFEHCGEIQNFVDDNCGTRMAA